MRRTFLAALAATTLTTADAAELWVGLDMSDSAPLLLEDEQAGAAGITIAEAIRHLERGDRIRILSFGESGVTGRQIDLTIDLSSRNRPEVIAPQVQDLISSLPERARAGDLRLEGQTNAVGFIERIGPLLDCQTMPTTLLMMTDGIEWSTAVTGRELLEGSPLPSPSGAILSGCNVVFWGLGQQQRGYGHDDAWYVILRKVWSDYMTQAGVASFAAYGEYRR